MIGLGCVAVDEVLCVPSFPKADQKLQVKECIRRFGGLTGAALVAAARLGARCAYAGCLGKDEASGQVAANFVAEGINVAHAPRFAQGRIVQSIIIVGKDRGTRNVFYRADGQIGAHPRLPSASMLRAAKVLLIDDYGMAGNLRAARIARRSSVPVVADFEKTGTPGLRQVMDVVDHLIVSESFACAFTGASHAAEAAVALWHPGRAAVIVTCGKHGSYCVSSTGQTRACLTPAYRVLEADTTGCGDVFHGAYAASLAQGESLERRVAFASAAAALKARDLETPRRAQVEQFLNALPTRERRSTRSTRTRRGIRVSLRSSAKS